MKIYRKPSTYSVSDTLSIFAPIAVMVMSILVFCGYYLMFPPYDEVSTFSSDGHQYKKFYDVKKGSIGIVHDPDCPCYKMTKETKETK